MRVSRGARNRDGVMTRGDWRRSRRSAATAFAKPYVVNTNTSIPRSWFMVTTRSEYWDLVARALDVRATHVRVYLLEQKMSDVCTMKRVRAIGERHGVSTAYLMCYACNTDLCKRQDAFMCHSYTERIHALHKSVWTRATSTMHRIFGRFKFRSGYFSCTDWSCNCA